MCSGYVESVLQVILKVYSGCHRDLVILVKVYWKCIESVFSVFQGFLESFL